jgi:hypothetical protein
LAAAAFYPKVDRATLAFLSKAGWSLGCISAVDRAGRTIWIADAHRDDGKCFIVRADEKLTAFLELERAVCRNRLTSISASAFERYKRQHKSSFQKIDLNNLGEEQFSR